VITFLGLRAREPERRSAGSDRTAALGCIVEGVIQAEAAEQAKLN
jgi:hypothetical protein